MQLENVKAEYDKLQIKYGAKEYKVYPVYYAIGNGMMNIEKAVEDIKFIIETN
jgi:hypothetical protein